MSKVKTEKVIKRWGVGTVNAVQSELIVRGASALSRNFIANEDKIELLGGRKLVGVELTTNTPCLGLHSIQKQDGTWVMVRKNDTSLQGFDFITADWVDIKTGLLAGEEMYFSNSYTPAGRQIWGCGNDGLFKIYPSALVDEIDLTNASKNYKGYILIEKSRMFCVNMDKDPTGLRYSHVDADVNYTVVASEAAGSGTAKDYTGTLAKTQVFGVVFTKGAEVLTDNKDGLLTGNGTGTINYATGAFVLHFTTSNATAVTASYLWEDPLTNGLADYSVSATRLAGEGNVLRQDSFGTRSKAIISFDGTYFTLQDRGSWKLKIEANDTDLTNLPFNEKVSCSSALGLVAVSDGIIYIDTTEDLKPKLRKLAYNDLGDKIVPKELSQMYSFEGYDFSKCAMIQFNDFIIFTGRSETGTVNDTTFFYNLVTGGIFAADNGYDMLEVCGNKIYGGDSSSPNVYELFDTYSDLGSNIEGEFIGGNDTLDTEQLKKLKKFYVEGFIDPAQSFEIQLSFDLEDWLTIGTITAADITIDMGDQSVGSVLFGDDIYGGSDEGTDPDFYKKAFKVRTKKFERVRYRILPSGIGYLSITQVKFSDVRSKGTKTLRKYKTQTV